MNTLDFLIKIKAFGSGEVAKKAAELQSQLEKADHAAKSLSNSIGGSLKNAFMSLPGAEFITNPIVAMTAGIGTVAKLGMEAEKTAKSFDVMVGSTDKSSKMLGEIYKYADDTLWNRTDMSQAAQSLLAYSVPAEKVVDDLKMLGDISLGDKNKMQTLASVFGQINAAGKLMTQDYKQLINVGFNPLNDIAAMTGKSISTLQDEMSKGTISFDLFEKAVQHATAAGGKYHGMIDSLASTTSGSFEQLKGQFSAILLDIYEIIKPLINDVFGLLKSVLSALSPVIQAVGWVFGLLAKGKTAVIALTAAVVAYNAVQLVTNKLLNGWTIATRLQFAWMLLVEKAQWLLNAAMMANPIGIVIALVAAVVAVVAVCWKKFDGFRAVILTVWDTLKGFGGILKTFVIDRIRGIISGLGLMGSAIGKLFKGDFSGAAADARQGLKDFSGISAMQNAAASSAGLVKGIKGNYQQRKEAESKKEISTPGLAGVAATSAVSTGASAYGGSSSKNADSITTGGTRNTQITMSIGKLVEAMNVSMNGTSDTAELQSKITESITRALQIGLSAAR